LGALQEEEPAGCRRSQETKGELVLRGYDRWSTARRAGR
jgi:hypothetical protein